MNFQKFKFAKSADIIGKCHHDFDMSIKSQRVDVLLHLC